jgi:hypothetical protein
MIILGCLRFDGGSTGSPTAQRSAQRQAQRPAPERVEGPGKIISSATT